MVDLRKIAESLIQGNASQIRELVQQAIDDGQDTGHDITRRTYCGNECDRRQVQNERDIYP